MQLLNKSTVKAIQMKYPNKELRANAQLSLKYRILG
jgi:hypothetical protein